MLLSEHQTAQLTGSQKGQATEDADDELLDVTLLDDDWPAQDSGSQVGHGMDDVDDELLDVVLEELQFKPMIHAGHETEEEDVLRSFPVELEEPPSHDARRGLQAAGAGLSDEEDDEELVVIGATASDDSSDEDDEEDDVGEEKAEEIDEVDVDDASLVDDVIADEEGIGAV